MNNAEAIPAKKRDRVSGSIPPGPKGSLIMGVMRDFNRDTLEFVTRCRDYGDVVRTRFLWVNAYFLYNPRDIESLLVTNAKSYRKARSLRSPFFYRLVGNGLVTSEGDFWRRQRRLAQPAFHRDRISEYGKVMTDYTEQMLDGWREGGPLDIHQEMMVLTLRVAVKTLFNVDAERDVVLMSALSNELIEMFALQEGSFWLAHNYLPTPAHRRFRKLIERLDRYIYDIIRRRREEGRDRGDLLSMLLQAQDEDGSQMTDRCSGLGG